MAETEVAANQHCARAQGIDEEAANEIFGRDRGKLGIEAENEGGVDAKLLDQIANLDWKDTPNPISSSQFKEYYLPQFESMGTSAYWVQAGQTIWGDLP